jgi:DnaK suppressor protein
MNQSDRTYFKELIEKKKCTARDEVDHIDTVWGLRPDGDDVIDEVECYCDPVEKIRRQSQKSAASARLDSRSAHLNALDEALERIEDGTFGTCFDCGGDIGRKRLEAMPHTTQCIACKTKEERRNSRMR